MAEKTHISPGKPHSPRSFEVVTLLALCSAAGVVLLLSSTSQAGGPKYVAGTTYFNPGTAGTPLTWSQGLIHYYTDQGNLSAILPGPSADALVADAFAQWTAIPTAAVAATHAGQLAEDVSGADVTRNSDGTINLPPDMKPAAIGVPVGVVYDADGSVTDALLGSGAGGVDSCFTNAAFGGVDNFGADAHFLHALVILNGNCAQTSAQVPDLEYHLVRVLGRVFGLDWSQLNLNVITGNPRPVAADYSGFPVMHNIDSVSCVPISLCYSNGGISSPYKPKMDDQAALSRLYPVTSQNASNFPGKQVFSQTTARIHGSVYFEGPSGQAAQGMQGVNVVARWIDPATGLPSRSVAAASVSGFLFTGNAGTTITGFDDPATAVPLTKFGSADQAVEGFFDLSGLQIPNATIPNAMTGQYQVSVEPLDPLWSENVGPYGPLQVTPSGTFQPVKVDVSVGGDIQQDIVMQGSALGKVAWFEPTTYASPAPLPEGGDWAENLTGYGTTDYFWFNAQSNRTLSVIVKAVDETANNSQNKLQPVVGMWALSDPGIFPAPAETPSAFNTIFFGETRLDATLLESTSFRLGIADYRGDGRPDFRYHARVFYGDNVFPARASVAGNTPLAIKGLGFLANTSVAIGNSNPPLLAVSGKYLLIDAPPMGDGIKDITLSDNATGGNSVMTGVLTYGAGPTDVIRLLPGGNPAVPVGGQTVNPIRFQVVADDLKTPIAGASVFLSSSPIVAFGVCGGAPSCTVLTDQSGEVSTLVTVLVPGTITITAQLAPASYMIPQRVQTVLFGRSSALDISLITPNVWIAQGATLSIPVTVRVLSNGSPVAGEAVNFTLKGSGTLSALSANSDARGYATTTLRLNSIATEVDINACIFGVTVTCPTFAALAVPTSNLQLHPVSGSIQVMPVGIAFAPVLVRVTDQTQPPNPVWGASVSFQSITGRSPNNQPILWISQSGISQPTVPVILGESQSTAISDINGLTIAQPTVGDIQGPVVILGAASVGNSEFGFAMQSLLPYVP